METSPLGNACAAGKADTGATMDEITRELEQEMRLYLAVLRSTPGDEDARERLRAAAVRYAAIARPRLVVRADVLPSGADYPAVLTAGAA